MTILKAIRWRLQLIREGVWDALKGIRIDLVFTPFDWHVRWDWNVEDPFIAEWFHIKGQIGPFSLGFEI